MTAYPNFDPARDIPSLAGKTIIITGGTAGLGIETITQLVKHNPKKIIFTGRNENAANKVIQDLGTGANLAFAKTDFGSLAAVKTSADRIARENPEIDLLICNAGIMAVQKGLTQDGYEIQFGTNHLAHALLIKLLLPSLQAVSSKPGGDARIIVLSSLGGLMSTGIDIPTLGTEQNAMILGAWRRYGQSKLANILYAQQLALRYPAITTVSIHPGVVGSTDLVRGLSFGNRMFMNVTTIGMHITVPDGAKNQLWAATCPKKDLQNGLFYEPVGKVGRQNGDTKNVKLAEELWSWTEEQLKPYV